MGTQIASGALDPLITRLSRFVSFTDRDLRALNALSPSIERFGARVDIVAEGDTPRSAFVLVEGMACRYRVLSNGRRQILAFILPGDISDLHGFLSRRMDHSISTIIPTRIARVTRETAARVVAAHPRIAAALRLSTIQGEAMLRERVVALGRRDARGRVAYLLCELVWRHQANGMSGIVAIRLPLTQVEIADTLGLTPVHVNRVLQEFRRNGLITLHHGWLALRDIENVQRIAELTDDYLQLGGISREGESYLDRLDRLDRDHLSPERHRQSWS